MSSKFTAYDLDYDMSHEYTLVCNNLPYLLDNEDEIKEWLKSYTKTGRIEGVVVVFDIPEERTWFILRWS